MSQMYKNCYATIFCCCAKKEEHKNYLAGEQELRNKEVKDMFDLFDEDKSGLVTKEEIRKVFSVARLPITDQCTQGLIDEFDSNGDNQLDFKEFRLLMKKYLSDPRNSTQYMFNVFDIDGDGYVTIEEFKKSMRCVGIDLKEEQVDEFIPFFFSEGKNKIDFDGFNKMLQQLIRKTC